MLNCRPYICNFPDPGRYRRFARWCCPSCGALYVRMKPLGGINLWNRLRRRLGLDHWSAPDGYWVLVER